MSNKIMNYPSPTTYQKNIRYIPDSPAITISEAKKRKLFLIKALLISLELDIINLINII